MELKGERDGAEGFQEWVSLDSQRVKLEKEPVLTNKKNGHVSKHTVITGNWGSRRKAWCAFRISQYKILLLQSLQS